MTEPLHGDTPRAGTYALRLVKGGPRVACRIWFGAAIIDDEEQDRSHAWRCMIDGQTDRVEAGDGGYRCRMPLEISRAWPWCAREPVTTAEYLYLLQLGQWAKQHAPTHPLASPRKPVDLNSQKGIF